MTTSLRPWTLLLALTAILGGCSETYPDEEMHFGLEDKTRPYAITLEPPEASPGESVVVTLHYHAARPSAMSATWRVALDFADGPYEADRIERRLVPLDAVPPPTVDRHGFATQRFTYTVPDSVPLWSTHLPEVIADPDLLALLGALSIGQPGRPPRKGEVDAWLRALTSDDLAALDEPARLTVQRLADLFACAIRFRASLDDGAMTVDVTRSLTVRYSRRLASANVNTNAAITRWAIGVIAERDVDLRQLDRWEDRIVWHEFSGTSPDGLPEARVVAGADHTCFLRVRFEPQRYTSPFEPDAEVQEQGEYRWYYYRLDAPGSSHRLLANNDGEETEMWELDDDVRLLPPGGNSRYRLLAVVRDVRVEWVQFAASPGATVVVVEVVFEGLSTR